jgi:uncharacterized protein (DUF2249 family)
MIDITLETKIADLLDSHPTMKDILIDINPKFKKLNNPVLRRTIAKIATIKQAAIVGGMEPMELVNILREKFNQERLTFDDMESISDIKPSWTEQESRATLDANELLDREDNPLAKAFNILREFEVGDILTISSDFKPQPLIDEFEKKGFEVYCEELSDKEFITYVKKVN